MRIFIDGPSILWTALRGGVDKENGRKVLDEKGKEVQVNGHQYGFEKALNMVRAFLKKTGSTPMEIVWVWEGMHSKSFRRKKAPRRDYKGNRDTSPDEMNIEFGKAKDALTKFFLDLGASTCTQDRIEGDDVLRFLSLHCEEECAIFSHDGDLSYCVGENPKGHMVHVGNNDKYDVNPIVEGMPFEHLLIYKSLVGDKSDNIKGAKGFGEAGFAKLVAVFGFEGLDHIKTLIESRKLDDLLPNIEDVKEIKAITNDHDGVYDSYALAKLYPEAVDTMDNPLVWKYGMVKQAADQPAGYPEWSHWYGRTTLIHEGNKADYTDEIMKLAQKTKWIALDLETDVPEEAREWLAAKGKPDGVDTLSSEIVSNALTLGDNQQHTYYFTYDHLPADGIENIGLEYFDALLQDLINIGSQFVIHNAGGFELPVLRSHFEFECEEKWGGMLPNVLCTQMLCSYVDENTPNGLKRATKDYLGYDQTTYKEVTTKYRSESQIEMMDGAEVEVQVMVPYQVGMRGLTANEALAYGADDTIVTSALFNHFSLRVQLEDAWQAYLAVEQLPAYLTAQAYLDGMPFSLETMFRLQKNDDEIYDAAWKLVMPYLIKKGWAGTQVPDLGEFSTAGVKEAYNILTGEVLKTSVRKPEKLLAIIAEELDQFHFAFEAWANGDDKHINELVKRKFKGEPELNLGSPKQMSKLMYEVMELPVRLRNDLTDKMREKGLTEGNPQTNADAMLHALTFDAEGEVKEVLENLMVMKRVATRYSLFYAKYPGMIHWVTGKIHPSMMQCATATRRYAVSDPNSQQWPKRGDDATFRQAIVPHKKNAIVFSYDFDGQELRISAEYTQDENMLSCFVGDNLKDVHSLVAVAASAHQWEQEIEYDDFIEQLVCADITKQKAAKNLRGGAKTVNFSAQYGGQAAKIALKMRCSVEEAQTFLDARTKQFPGVSAWNEKVIHDVKRIGYTTTMLGARRHLRDRLMSEDWGISSKAERQAGNFKVQGSGAEMAKLAMARMQERGLFRRYDAQFYGPVHDEVFGSVVVDEHLIDFLKEMHACMTEKYATMEVPIESALSIGLNFGEQHEMGKSIVPEQINAQLTKLGFKL